MKKTALLFVLGWLWLTGCTPKFQMYQQDVSPGFLPNHLILTDTRNEGDSLRVYMRFEDTVRFTGLGAGGMQLVRYLKPGYESKETIWQDTLPNLGARVQTHNGYATLTFALPMAKVKQHAVLALRFGPAAFPEQQHWLDLHLTPKLLEKKHILRDRISGEHIFQSYVTNTQIFDVERYGAPLPLQAKQYEANFDPALPPMSVQGAAPQPTIPLRQKLPFAPGEPVLLPETGLYLMEFSDGSNFGLLVQEGDFPQLTTAEDLIQPLIYITTSKERQKLYDAPEPKLALDSFWLELGEDKALAKQLIRRYYQNVTNANKLFSSHKAGWLTDRGMIYTVLGPPDQVHRTFEREEWLYFSGPRAGVRFTFRKIQNIFTNNHYELIRDRLYEPVWYSEVDKWRNGIIKK